MCDLSWKTEASGQVRIPATWLQVQSSILAASESQSHGLESHMGFWLDLSPSTWVHSEINAFKLNEILNMKSIYIIQFICQNFNDRYSFGIIFYF